MELTGKQKAAMLLTYLDAETVVKLVKGLSQEDIQDIGMEMARIDAFGSSDDKIRMKVAREFCDSLQKGLTPGFSIKGFFGEILAGILGKDKVEQIQSKIRKEAGRKDPFAAIRSASKDELVLALKGKHHQIIAVVLSELPTRKSQEIMSLLDKETCIKVVSRMAIMDTVNPEVRQRIASMVSKELEIFKGETLPEGRAQTLRKLAILLSGLEKDLRDQLLHEIEEYDGKTCATIRTLMITWEDIPSIANRSLQEALRNIESKKLAVALHGADEEIIKKIRSNISERANEMLEEEISLMQPPLENEILNAREEIVNPLREANEQGKLRVTGR